MEIVKVGGRNFTLYFIIFSVQQIVRVLNNTACLLEVKLPSKGMIIIFEDAFKLLKIGISKVGSRLHFSDSGIPRRK